MENLVEESNIDWSIYRNYPFDVVYCNCNNIYLSHTIYRGFRHRKEYRLISEYPCNECGQNNNIKAIKQTDVIWTQNINQVKLSNYLNTNN